MISESVIIVGETGRVVLLVNDELPQQGMLFRVGASKLELVTPDNVVVYAERGLDTHVCHQLKQKNEIGVIEIKDPANPPKVLTNVIYQAGR